MSGAALQGGSPASRLHPAGPAASAAQCVAQEQPPEALDSKVSLKLSPEHRSSTLSGPVSACFQAAAYTPGAEGEQWGGLWARSFPSWDAGAALGHLHAFKGYSWLQPPTC